MNLLLFLATEILMATDFGESFEGFWKPDADSPIIDNMLLQALFDKSTVKSGTGKSSKLGAYNSLQKDNSDDTVSAQLLQLRIIGGTTAKYGDIPWQAILVSSTTGGQSFQLCGASIINHFWLLTAAHCFDGYEPDQFQVTVGKYNLYATDRYEQSFTIRKLYIHDGYMKEKYNHDIALIRINPSSDGEGILFNKFVQPIMLPGPSTSLPHRLLVSGWGVTVPCVDCGVEPQTASHVLKGTLVSIIDQRKCQLKQPKVTSRMFCAGDDMNDSCSGDSGGPAAYYTAGQYVLYGIVSWGEGCAQPGLPGVYTRVSAYLPWIRGIMQLAS